MNRFFSLMWGVAAVMVTATNAPALDDFSAFTMKGVGNDVDPFELTCKQYAGLDAGTRRLLTSYLEGYAAEGSSTAYAEGAVRNFEAGILAACAKAPDSPLDELLENVQYDVPEGGAEPGCSALLKTSAPEEAAKLLLWTQGYLESELAENTETDFDQAIHQDTFREDAAAVLEQCKADNEGKLIEVMRTLMMGD